MSYTVIDVENISKEYRLGVIGHGTLYRDLQSWWARIRKRQDPNAQILAEQRKHGDKFWAIKDISFKVQAGERVGIIGRNGAGKSTLLKILSRVTIPTSGRVRLKGRVASLLEVGTGFHPELTGRENIFLNGAILGMNRGEVRKKLDEIIDFAGVQDYIDTPVKRYSSGMYVRLAFAVAAHLEPDILIVDEVLAVGDVEFQKKCLGKLQDVSDNEGRTVLFVSHSMEAIRKLCQRGILLDDGKIAVEGNTDTVVDSYLAEEKKGDIQWDIPGQRAKIVNVKLRNRKGEMTREFRPDDCLDISIDFECRAAFENPICKLMIYYGEGLMFGANTLLDGVSHSFKQGSVNLRCRFEQLPLRPGPYKIELAIREPIANEGIFGRANIARFSIVGSEAEYGLSPMLISGHGSYMAMIPYTWDTPKGPHGVDVLKQSQSGAGS